MMFSNFHQHIEANAVRDAVAAALTAAFPGSEVR